MPVPGGARWVGAVDGGGTKTAAALADREGRVRRLPPLPGSSPQDGPAWEGVLGAALAGLAGAEGGLAAAALGVAGRGEVPAHDRAVDDLLARGLPCPLDAMNDVALAHLGAFGGGHGVLLLSGTGSMAWARGPLGEARVGGWGDAFGDEGSAHSIGRETLMIASRIIDGRLPPRDEFIKALLAKLGPDAEGPFAPLTWLMAKGQGRAALAGLARHVDELAREGHEQAEVILNEAADDLSWLARTAARRVGLTEPLLWAPSGSVFKSCTVVAGLTEWLGPPTPPRLSTLGGGLLHAARLAGWGVDDAWAARVDAALSPPPGAA